MTLCSKDVLKRLLIRVDTSTRWETFNPILCDQEIAYDRSNGRFKVGDGSTSWTNLPYSAVGGEGVFIEAGSNVTIYGSGAEDDPYIISVSTGSTGIEVTDSSKRTALKTGTNYVNPDSASDAYYPIMTLNIITGQAEGDYYIGFDSVNTRDLYLYKYLKIDSALKWVRQPIAYSIPTA